MDGWMDRPTERTDGSTTRTLHRATDGRTVSFVVDRNSTLDRSLDRSTRSSSRALISINHPFVRSFVCRSFERLGNSTEPNRRKER